MDIKLKADDIYNVINSLPKFSLNPFLSETTFNPGLQVARNFSGIGNFIENNFGFGFALWSPNEADIVKNLLPDFICHRITYINVHLRDYYFQISWKTEKIYDDINFGRVKYVCTKDYVSVQHRKEYRIYPYVFIRLNKAGNVIFEPNDCIIAIHKDHVIDSPESRKWLLEHL